MSVLLWGGKSQARVVESMLADQGVEVSAIFDPTLKAPSFSTKARFSNQISEMPELIEAVDGFYICIGAEHGFARVQLMTEIKKRFSTKLLSIVSEESFIDLTAEVGPGLLAMPRAIVQKFCVLSEGVVLNTGSIVDHECTLGRGVHIMPGAVLAGRVQVGDFATIGSNATVLPDVKIGQHAYVGAGSVVIEDIPDFAVAVGAPAKVIRKREAVVDRSFVES